MLNATPIPDDILQTDAYLETRILLEQAATAGLKTIKPATSRRNTTWCSNGTTWTGVSCFWAVPMSVGKPSSTEWLWIWHSSRQCRLWVLLVWVIPDFQCKKHCEQIRRIPRLKPASRLCRSAAMTSARFPPVVEFVTSTGYKRCGRRSARYVGAFRHDRGNSGLGRRPSPRAAFARINR
jgi:hypothetical protein